MAPQYYPGEVCKHNMPQGLPQSEANRLSSHDVFQLHVLLEAEIFECWNFITAFGLTKSVT